MARKSLPPKYSAPTKAIVNAFSTSGWASLTIDVDVSAKSIASGSLTATTLETILSVTGAGEMNYLTLKSLDATVRTMRIQVICDGSTVFDSTSASAAHNGESGVVLGQMVATGGPYTFAESGESIRWNTSLKVNVASSLTETDKFNIYTKYRLS